MFDIDKWFDGDDVNDGWLRLSGIECDLPSGRKFRYQMEDYPIRVDASEWELDELACRIIKDKYRYCQWDREHPQTNQEVEIFDALKVLLLRYVAQARLVRDEDAAARPAEPSVAPERRPLKD